MVADDVYCKSNHLARKQKFFRKIRKNWLLADDAYCMFNRLLHVQPFSKENRNFSEKLE
jgi:hypothetical protein